MQVGENMGNTKKKTLLKILQTPVYYFLANYLTNIIKTQSRYTKADNLQDKPSCTERITHLSLLGNSKITFCLSKLLFVPLHAHLLPLTSYTNCYLTQRFPFKKSELETKVSEINLCQLILFFSSRTISYHFTCLQDQRSDFFSCSI